jgi:hypothetical protein
MSDPLSIVRGIILIATLTLTSSKAVYELISTISEAPTTIRDLVDNIHGLSQVLSTVTQLHIQCASNLTESQLICLSTLNQFSKGVRLLASASKQRSRASQPTQKTDEEASEMA